MKATATTHMPFAQPCALLIYHRGFFLPLSMFLLLYIKHFVVVILKILRTIREEFGP